MLDDSQYIYTSRKTKMEVATTYHADHCGPSEVKGAYKLIHKDQPDFGTYVELLKYHECAVDKSIEWVALALDTNRMLVGFVTVKTCTQHSRRSILVHVRLTKAKGEAKCPLSILVPLLQLLEDGIQPAPYSLAVGTDHLSPDLHRLLLVCQWSSRPQVQLLTKTLVPRHLRTST